MDDKKKDILGSEESITPETLKKLRSSENNQSSNETITPETLKNLRKSEEYANREYGEIPSVNTPVIDNTEDFDENEENVNPDVYYDDLEEFQQEEIDAAEAAKAEKEEKKEKAKEKAKKEARVREKHRQEAERIKERERLDREAAKRAAEDNKSKENYGSDEHHTDELSSTETRNRQYYDEDIEREAEAKKESQQAYREEVKQATVERREKIENYQSFGKEGIDFSGREQHSAHKESVEEQKSYDEPVYKDTDKKESTYKSDYKQPEYKEEYKPETSHKEERPGFVSAETHKEEAVKSDYGHKEPEYTQQHLNEKFEQEHKTEAPIHKEPEYKEPQYKTEEPVKTESHRDPVITPPIKEEEHKSTSHYDNVRKDETHREETTTHHDEPKTTEYSKSHQEELYEREYKETHKTNPIGDMVIEKPKTPIYDEEPSRTEPVRHTEYKEPLKDTYREPEREKTTHTEYRDGENITKETKDFGSHKEEQVVHHEEKSVFEERNRQYFDEDQAKKEAAHKEKVEAYREEIKEAATERRERNENYQSFGKEGVDFSGKENHTAYKEESSTSKIEEPIRKEEKSSGNTVIPPVNDDISSHTSEYSQSHLNEKFEQEHAPIDKKEDIHHKEESEKVSSERFEPRKDHISHKTEDIGSTVINDKTESHKAEPITHVETNMGKMPIEDYREIKAQQHGFDSYDDMYKQGYRLGNGYDKEPEDVKPHTAEQPKYDDVRDTEYSRQHLNEKFEQEHSVPNKENIHREDVKATHHDESVRGAENDRKVSGIVDNDSHKTVDTKTETRHDDKVAPGVIINDRDSHKQNADIHEESQYSRNHINERAEQEHKTEPTKVRTTREEPINEGKAVDIHQKDEKSNGHVAGATIHTEKESIHKQDIRSNEPEYSKEHLNDRFEQHMNASHKDAKEINKELHDLGNKTAENRDNKASDVASNQKTGHKDAVQSEYSRQHLNERADQHKEEANKGHKIDKPLNHQVKDDDKVIGDNNHTENKTSHDGYSMNHRNERMEQIMSQRKQGQGSVINPDKKAVDTVIGKEAVNKGPASINKTENSHIGDYSKNHLNERMEQHLENKGTSKVRPGSRLITDTENTHGTKFDGTKENILKNRHGNKEEMFAGPVKTFSSYTPAGVVVAQLHNNGSREQLNNFNHTMLTNAGRIPGNANMIKDNRFSGVEDNVHRVRMMGNSNIQLIQKDGQNVARLVNAKIVNKDSTSGINSYVPMGKGGGPNGPGGGNHPKNPMPSNFNKNMVIGKAAGLNERKIRLAHAERLGLTFGNAGIGVTRAIGDKLYTTVEYGDYGGLHEAKETKRNIKTAYNSIYVVRNSFRRVNDTYHAASHTMTALGNAGRYIKGIDMNKVNDEIKSLQSFVGPLTLDQTNRLNKLLKIQKASKYKTFMPTTIKGYENQLRGYGMLRQSTRWQIKKEIYGLKKLKVLTPEQAKRLADLTGYLKLTELGSALHRESRAKRSVTDSFSHMLHNLFRENESSSIEGLMATTDFLSNRYVRGLMKTQLRLSYYGVRSIGHATVGGIGWVGKKTGATEKIVNSRLANGVRTVGGAVQRGVHGGIYNAGKNAAGKGAEALGKGTINTYKKVAVKTGFDKTKLGKGIANTASHAPTRIKTAIDKSKVASSKAKAVLDKFKNNKVTRGIKKGFEIVSTPFKMFKEAGILLGAAAGKAKKLAVVAAGGLLLIILFMSVITSIFGSVYSVIMTDKNNLQEYVTYITDLQNNLLDEVHQKADELVDEYDSLNPVQYEYTHKQSLSNTKEILSMAAVWGKQEWPKWYQGGNFELKDYIYNLFDNSNYYRYYVGAPYSCYPGCKTRLEGYSHSGGCRTDDEGNSYCPGHTRTVRYCPGHHRDVIIQVICLSFDEIFNYDNIGHDPDPSRNWEGWWKAVWNEEKGYMESVDTGNVAWAKNIYNQDWYELYGVSFGGQDFVPSPILAKDAQEIRDKISEQYPNLSQERWNIVNSALSLVGKVPYFWGGGHHQNLDPEIDPAWGVEMRVVSASGYSKQPAGTYHLYGLDCSGFSRWVILNATGRDTMYSGARGQRSLGIARHRSQLQPGDFANTGDDGHVGIYLYTDENGNMVFVHSSPSVNGVNINAPGYFTQFYTPRGITS